ncbi:MAG: hypothetical protein ACLFTA_02250 [Candidatus Nanohaloarchaea archaeon]
MSVLNYGRSAASKTGALGLGTLSTPFAILGGASLIYGASKIGTEEASDIMETAETGLDAVNTYLDEEESGLEDIELELPEYSEESLENISSAAKYGLGGLVLGGIGALGYRKARNMW